MGTYYALLCSCGTALELDKNPSRHAKEIGEFMWGGHTCKSLWPSFKIIDDSSCGDWSETVFEWSSHDPDMPWMFAQEQAMQYEKAKTTRARLLSFMHIIMHHYKYIDGEALAARSTGSASLTFNFPIAILPNELKEFLKFMNYDVSQAAENYDKCKKAIKIIKIGIPPPTGLFEEDNNNDN